MKYTKYITKKRFKGEAIGGYINLPYGTICDVYGEFIYYNNRKICALTSQNAYDYFWGYNPDNPGCEIERQKLATQLINSTPKNDIDSLLNPKSHWNSYGKLIDYGFDMLVWQWDEHIFELMKKFNIYCDALRREKNRLYKIIKDGNIVAIAESLRFIRQHTNGCFVLADEKEAQGIALENGNFVYNLIGREKMKNVDEAVGFSEVVGIYYHVYLYRRKT